MKLFRLLKVSLLSLLIGLAVSAGLASAEASLELYLEDMSQTVYCPDNDAWHTHGYRNETRPDTGHESYMAVTKLRMYLHDDFVDSINLSTLECSVPITSDEPTGYISCDGSRVDSNGGTSINLEPAHGSTDAYVEWEYGLDDSSGKPIAPGYNDYDYDGVVELSELDRTVYETIDFEFNADAITGDSATTTSALYVQFWDYDETGCGDWSDSDCWEATEEDGETAKHWNTHTYTLETNYECEEEALNCSKLVINPATLSVDDVFSDTDFSLTATNNLGEDITDEVDITYEAFQYDGSASTGDLMTGPLNLINQNSGPVETSDTEIKYRDSLPGDRITAFVSDYEGESYEGTGLCEVEVEFPYCTELNITDPSSFAFISTGDVDMPIEIEAYANNGEEWPYSVDYNSTDVAATFDGDVSTYTTTDWTIDSYQSSENASVWVELDDENGDGISDDVGPVDEPYCSATFSYGVQPTCESLEITIPTTQPLTCEEMTAGDIQITWESLMTSGAPATGPWLVTSSNSSGTFSLTSGGATVGTGTYVSAVKTLYYNGADGDTIQVMDMSYPLCLDTLESESCEDTPAVCEDLSLSEPYINNADGTTTTIDLTDDTDLETMYGESTVCWDYSLTVSDAAYTGRIIAEGFTDGTRTTHNGTLTLTVDETATSDVGNPATVAPVTGFAAYNGTLCWENFEAGNTLSIFMLGDALICSDSEELPPPAPEAPVCVDLQMSPDTYTMSATDADAGNIPVVIDVQGSDATWTGTLIVTHTGTGALFYSDGSPSTAGDGHLTIPVSGTSYSVTVFYRNGHEGDVVTSVIKGDDEICGDTFTITQSDADLFCEDLTLSPDSVTMEADAEDAGTINGTVVVTGSDSEWTGTLIITKNGVGQLRYSNGSSSSESDGHLEVPVSGTSSTVTFTYVGGDEPDTVTAYIEADPNVCIDTFSLTQEENPDIVCEDIDFSEEEILVDANCQDSPAMEVCIEKDSDDERTIEICYENQDGDDGEFTFEGETYEGCEEITIEFGPGETSQCLDIQFSEVCEDAEISVSEGGEVCEDLSVEEVEMGTFNKFIYTFNFSSEKNSYSDEGVFFSHDEDRAFYTLQYEPTGDEEAITFTDEMWGSDLEGHKGDGSDSGGYVRLATTYEELVKGESGVYDYTLITKMGFGDAQEENSDDLAAYVDSAEFQSNFKNFIPYVKITGAESVLIKECEYDGDELETETVCYDPDHSPTNSEEDVVIENAGTVYETYGSSAAIRIRYVGVIYSGLDCGDSADECLTEEFENSASVEVYENLDALTAKARLVVLCSYLMTQNAGDVYLEVSLEAGSDIACIFVDEDDATSSDYRNVDALVILEDQGSSSSTDSTYESTYSGSTVSWCDDDSSQNVIGNLSSYVCEIVAKVTELWARTTVESTTETHVDQAIRNADTNQSSSDSSYATWDELKDVLTNNNNPDSNILYFAGDPDSTTDAVTLGDITVPAGAWTVIVEDANLILNGNIAYASVSTAGDYKNLPSIAFVVQGGDIYINDNALRLVGVFYTDQKFDGDERSAVDEQLTVDGSFYGNIQTLIERAKYVGPPTVDGGGIVIRYDSRILLNTPPGLSEYVDINTEKGVN